MVEHHVAMNMAIEVIIGPVLSRMVLRATVHALEGLCHPCSLCSEHGLIVMSTGMAGQSGRHSPDSRPSWRKL